ncbi:MAG: hypothetical protein QM758_04760 [Armatimonas sp.]
MDRRLFLTLLFPIAEAAAQRDSVPEPVSLSKFLESTYWVPGTAKTLLVIGGRKAYPLPEKDFGSDENDYQEYYNQLRRKTMAQLGPAPPRGYALAAVAACYGRKVARFGQVASVVPQYRKTLNLAPGPSMPEPVAREGSVWLLIDALDDTGIKKLLSESGIGRGDLPRSVLPAFDALQPGPLWVRRGDQGKPFLALTAEQLPALRLRISLVSSLSAVKGEERAVDLIRSDQNRLNRAQAPDYVSKPWARPPRESLLIRLAPAQPLPTDLATETLNQRISLEGDSFFNLSKLAELIGKAEGITLAIPEMLENYSVEWRGDPEVRTGDVVRAITASVTGTFRECAGSFVLTDSLTPLGPRLEVVNRWLEKGDALHREPKSLPAEWGRFDASDPYPIPKPLRERLRESNGLRFSPAEFPDQKLLGSLLALRRASDPDFAPRISGWICGGR